MNLKGSGLEKWLVSAAKAGVDGLTPIYQKQYELSLEALNKYVQQEVTKGAIAQDGGFLTDHGPEHIKRVIACAGQLVDGIDCNLSAYECYLALMAIQFHDVGNAHGRLKHESKASEAMEFIGEAAGKNAIEKRMILQIARAHGGAINGSKDTISTLQPTTDLLGYTARPRLIAALLRFADELADDRNRASYFLMDKADFPDAARLYHFYAYSLHTVRVNHAAHSVVLKYELEDAVAGRQFTAPSGPVYLLDYIFERALKMHIERMYCMRFLWPHGLALETIEATVDVYSKKQLDQLGTIAFRLGDSGYPAVPNPTAIYDICPDLQRRAGWSGPVAGQALADLLLKGAANV